MASQSGTIDFETTFALHGINYAVKGQVEHYLGNVEKLFVEEAKCNGNAFDPYQAPPEKRGPLREAIINSIDKLLPRFS